MVEKREQLIQQLYDDTSNFNRFDCRHDKSKSSFRTEEQYQNFMSAWRNARTVMNRTKRKLDTLEKIDLQRKEK